MKRSRFSYVTVEQVDGYCCFRVNAPWLKNEIGGHRWQRIPPTERNGRVQTSTITVSVLPEVSFDAEISDSEISFEVFRGQGPGGQNRNKVETCIKATHKPTGVVVKATSERSQHANKQLAVALLSARVLDLTRQKQSDTINSDRRQQVGSGQRGDKRRTIRVRDNVVEDHVLNKSVSYKDYLKGVGF